MQAKKTTHGLDGQHQDLDRTFNGRVSHNDRGRDKWGKYVHGVANPQIEDGYRTEQNSLKLYFWVIASITLPSNIPQTELVE